MIRDEAYSYLFEIISCYSPLPHFITTLYFPMSKLSDYSKFDHLEDDDSDDDEKQGTPPPQQQEDQQAARVPASHEQQQQQEEQPEATTRKDPKTGRYVFEYGGTPIYEWEQSLEGAWETYGAARASV